MKLISIALLALLCLAGCAPKAAPSSAGPTPKNGYVPDENTAIAVAVAVSTSLNAGTPLARYPFKAKLEGNAWHVAESLPKDMLGGGVNFLISKEDGRVLSMWHEQ